MQTLQASPGIETVATRQTKELVAHLEKSEMFRSYQQAFETVTGLPLAIRAAGAFQPPLHGSKKSNSFCALMAATNKTCAACLQLQQKIEDESQCRASTGECFAGMSESAVPIRAGEKVVAFLQTGQVFLRKPSRARFTRVAQLLTEWGYELDMTEMEKAYFAGTVITQSQYTSILRLLTIFAEHLSSVSNQVMLQEAAAESPAVTKARAYIAAHKSEELSLPEVAAAVHMSPFYFCKTFRKATGMNFTDYVSRLRVENVKQLLLNPHKRVSEAAFEAGFQSLSQFNRAFRRVTGESPSDYRDRIHHAAPVAA